MFIDGNEYRLWIEPSYNFAADELNLFIVKRERGRYRPVTITINIGDLIEADEGTDIATTNDPPKSTMPNELALCLLRGLARYLMSSEGDMVATIKRLRDELAMERARLDKLISGIGRLGGHKENE